MADTGALISLKLKTLNNGTHEVEVPNNIEVEDLKRRLVGEVNIPLERQRLIYRGRLLNNGETLQDLGVGDGFTLHVVERPADAPAPNPQQNQQGQMPRDHSAHISVNLGNHDGSGNVVQDLGRMVQGVLRAVGVDNPVQVQMGHRIAPSSVASGAASQLNAGEAQTGGATLPSTGIATSVPHLLRALNCYLDKLDSGGLSTILHPASYVRRRGTGSNQSQEQGPSSAADVHALTSSICSILESAHMPDQLQRMVQDAQEGVRNHSEHSGDVLFDQSSVLGTATSNTSTEPYSHLPLLVAAFGHMVSRADSLFRERASQSLQNACQLLQAQTHVDESNQELLVGGLRQISSVLNWYGALFLELSRASACAVHAFNGNVLPIAANIATVIEADGSAPNIIPQLTRPNLRRPNDSTGMTASQLLGGQASVSATPEGYEQVVPSVGIVTVSGQEYGEADSQGLNPTADRVDVTLIEPSGQVYTATTGNQGESQTGPPVPDLSSLIGPIVQQIAAASAGLGSASQPQSQTPDPHTLANRAETAPSGPTSTAIPERQNPSVVSQPDSAPAADMRASGTRRGPSLGSGRGGPSLSRGPALGSQTRSRRVPSQPQSERTESTPQSQPGSTGSRGQPGIMSLLGSMIQRPPGGGDTNQPQGAQTSGGGLSALLSNMMNNPAVQRMAENPEILRMVDNVMGGGSESQGANDMMSRVSSQVIPMMTQMLSGDSQQQHNTRNAEVADLQTVLTRELSADEAARWSQIIQSDLDAQNYAAPQECLSEPYIAGEGLARTGGLSGILPDEDEMEEDKNETI